MTVNRDQIVESTAEFVKNTLKDAEGGHDWYHIKRVWQNALYIARREQKGDLLIIELAALLHDIADAKFNNGDESVGPKLAGDFLRSLSVPEDVITHVVQIINHISFRKHHEYNSFNSIEFQIVQDADRLDALGAIGIARAFNYGGFKNRPLYEQGVHGSMSDGKHNTIGHFYEKLLLLKDMMNTKTGSELAEDRHQFMENYLVQFYKEWDGLS